MQAGSSFVHELPNMKNFNLVDLSLLIRIFNETDNSELTNTGIGNVLLNKGGNILDVIYSNWQTDQEIVNITQKFTAVSA